MKPQIGTCGFGIARARYAELFSCVEVQHTFYQPPKISTLERWREEAPPDFEFVLKAWQLITHNAKSPTYRRLKRNLSEVEKQGAGYFRPTPIVKEAWKVTLACARALRARTILFQCPASFKPTKENIFHLKKFFSGLNRKHDEEFNFGWEPRGDWDSQTVTSLCEDLQLQHVVDPFTARSLTPNHLYFRLHGRNGWRYEYDETELRELAAMFSESIAKNNRKPRDGGLDKAQTPYVFFNNARMTKDALSFQALLEET
jgi:uncharacterized protein YecE (DUF72 family)